MLRDLQRVSDRDEALEPQQFRAAAARLLKDQFLFRERVGDRAALRLVSDHYGYFDDLFDALGWQLQRDDDFGVIGILPVEGQNHVRFRLVDTLMVLCLRLLYEEGMDRFEVRDGSVFIPASALIECFEARFSGRKLPPKTEFRELLARLRRHGLIEAGEAGDEGLPELRILPTIRWVTGTAVLDRIEAFAGDDDGLQDDDELLRTRAEPEGDDQMIELPVLEDLPTPTPDQDPDPTPQSAQEPPQ